MTLGMGVGAWEGYIREGVGVTLWGFLIVEISCSSAATDPPVSFHRMPIGASPENTQATNIRSRLHSGGCWQQRRLVVV